MLLVRLTLEDIGVYGGINEFNFETSENRPVVLYVGKNGAGKTTLLHSVLLCLYGQGAFGGSTTKKQYHDKIRGLLHKNAETGVRASSASISLEFQYARDGKIISYRVTRAWTRRDGKIIESLSLNRTPGDGVEYIPVEGGPSKCQREIDMCIPKAVANLFFIDNEKIGDLTEGDHAEYIRSSFDSLLGLDIPRQLHDDVGLYMLRNSDESSKITLDELERTISKRDSAEEMLGSFQEKRVFLESEIVGKRKDLEIREKEFFRIGGAAAEERQDLLSKKSELEEKVSCAENRLRRIVEGILPIAIAQDRIIQIREDLKRDEDTAKKELLGAALDEFLEELSVGLGSILDKYDPRLRTRVLEKISRVMTNKTNVRQSGRVRTYSLSLQELATLTDKIDSALVECKEICPSHSDRRAHLDAQEELDRVNAMLDVVPQQDEAGPLYSRIKETTLEIGEMEQECATLRNLEAQKRSILVLLNSNIRRLLTETKSAKSRQRGMEMLPRVQAALNVYADMLRASKIKLLESNILEGIRRCFSSNCFVEKISIDVETYRISMYRKNGDEFHEEQFSKGEMQLYLTAVIWGLAKTSGLPLPFIIDTPLARLDGEHRNGMVGEFYPEISHQIIILATDSEITPAYYEMLRPHTSQACMILCDKDRDHSMVEKLEVQGGNLVAI